jgi:hypothetical protein
MIEYIKFIEKNYKKMGLFFVLSCFVLLFSQKVVGMEPENFETSFQKLIDKFKENSVEENGDKEKMKNIKTLENMVYESKRMNQKNKYIEKTTTVLSDVLKNEEESDDVKIQAIGVLNWDVFNLEHDDQELEREKYIEEVTSGLRCVFEISKSGDYLLGFAIDFLLKISDLVILQEEENQKKYIEKLAFVIKSVLKKERGENLKNQMIRGVKDFLKMESMKKDVQKKYIEDLIPALIGVLKLDESENLKEETIWLLISLVKLVKNMEKDVKKKYIENVTDALIGVLRLKKGKSEDIKKCAILGLASSFIADGGNLLLLLKQEKEVQKKYIKDVTAALIDLLKLDESDNLNKFIIEKLTEKGDSGCYNLVDLVQDQKEEKVRKEYIEDVTAALIGVLKLNKNENLNEFIIKGLAAGSFDYNLINLVQNQKKEVQEKYIEYVTSALIGVLESDEKKWQDGLKSGIAEGLMDFNEFSTNRLIWLVQKQTKEIQKKYIKKIETAKIKDESGVVFARKEIFMKSAMVSNIDLEKNDTEEEQEDSLKSSLDLLVERLKSLKLQLQKQ